MSRHTHHNLKLMLCIFSENVFVDMTNEHCNKLSETCFMCNCLKCELSFSNGNYRAVRGQRTTTPLPYMAMQHTHTYGHPTTSITVLRSEIASKVMIDCIQLPT